MGAVPGGRSVFCVKLTAGVFVRVVCVNVFCDCVCVRVSLSMRPCVGRKSHNYNNEH